MLLILSYIVFLISLAFLIYSQITLTNAKIKLTESKNNYIFSEKINNETKELLKKAEELNNASLKHLDKASTLLKEKTKEDI